MILSIEEEGKTAVISSSRLGERLRAARAAKGYTLRELAAEIGVSASLLSQVENGKSLASVTTLHALVTALGISLDQLFTTDSQPRISTPMGTDAARLEALQPVHPAGNRPVLRMAGGVTWERLSSLLSHMVDAQLVTYEAGSSSSSDGTLSRHNGIEFAYLIEGELLLRLGYEEYRLEAGDSLSFDSTTPHMYENTGRTIARGVWFELGRRVPFGFAGDVASSLTRASAPPGL
jgi:transcriptional regulator with XRE-family HTH domain